MVGSHDLESVATILEGGRNFCKSVSPPFAPFCVCAFHAGLSINLCRVRGFVALFVAAGFFSPIDREVRNRVCARRRPAARAAVVAAFVFEFCIFKAIYQIQPEEDGAIRVLQSFKLKLIQPLDQEARSSDFTSCPRPSP